MQESEIVTVPFDYLLSMHIRLNASYEKIKELMGEKAANAFFSELADADLPGLQITPNSSVEELKRLLDEAGYKLEGNERNGMITFELYCPYAERIHPHLNPDASFCPMSQTVLSAIRKKYYKSIVTDGRLKENGSIFSIKVQD